MRACSSRVENMGDDRGFKQEVKGAMLARLKLQLTSATDHVSGMVWVRRLGDTAYSSCKMRAVERVRSVGRVRRGLRGDG